MTLIQAESAGPVDLDLFRSSTARVKPGLPSLAYTSDKFWGLEKEKLFPLEWILAGFAHEMAQAGDAMPVSVGDTPILLVRGRDNAIRAFHNVCRHRCLKLVNEPRNVGRMLTCPYHAWSYGLDGELRSTPYFGGTDPRSRPEGFDPKQHGLKPVRCAVWYDWIFVNVSGDAPPFEAFISPVQERLGDIDFSLAKLVGVVDLGVVHANWKFLVENFIEPYHVQFVHARTTEQPLANHYTIIDRNCLGSAVDLEESREGGDGSGRTLAVSSRYLSLFPTFVIGRYFPNQIGVHLNVPLGPAKTLQRRAIYVTDAIEPTEEAAESLKRLWIDVHREDHEICVRLQEGRKSEVAQDGGLLSPHWESSVRKFQELVADAID